MPVKFYVLRDFVEFGREYKRGKGLTDEDLSCWQPEDVKAEVLAALVRQLVIAPPAPDEAQA